MIYQRFRLRIIIIMIYNAIIIKCDENSYELAVQVISVQVNTYYIFLFILTVLNLQPSSVTVFRIIIVVLHVSVLETTLAHEFHIPYSHIPKGTCVFLEAN